MCDYKNVHFRPKFVLNSPEMAGGYTSIEEDETVEPGNQHSKLLIDYDAVLVG